MTEIAPASEAGARVFLDLVLHPYRSLPPRGFTLLMLALGLLSLVAGTACVLAGAWPVIGFFGIDVLLVYVAFRLSYRSARQHEAVRLTDQSLTVERVSVRGQRRSWRFEPVWLRVILEEQDEHRNRLLLASHGRALVLGSFLGPAERRNAARTIEGALARWRAWLSRS